MNRKIDDDHDVPVSSPVSGIKSPPRILRLKEVCKVTGLGRSCIYQLQAEKRAGGDDEHDIHALCR
jgi:hypothetical protein